MATLAGSAACAPLPGLSLNHFLFRPTIRMPGASSSVEAGFPIGLLALLLGVGQVLLWSFAFGVSYSAPEIDSAEQFVWAFSLENGYWKHPPAPTWILHALVGLFGPSVTLPFVLAQVSIVVALGLGWRLACEFMSPRRALIGTLLTSLVVYHNLGGDNFNHNTALLPFQAAMVLMFHRATRHGGLSRWALAGLFAGLAMLVKYVALMPIAGLLLYLVLDRRMHRREVLAGVAVATAVLTVVLLPHALWLHRTDFLPFRYAQSIAKSAPGFGSAVGSIGEFVFIQLLRLLPFLIGLAFVCRRAPQLLPRGPGPAAIASSDRLFLVIAALSPLVLTLLFCLATRTELQSRWGANGFLLVGVLAMAWWPRSDQAATLRRAVVVAISVHLAFAVTMTVSKTALADLLHRPTRANFPGAVLAKQAQEVWAQHTDAPLRIVVSDIWLGGNIVAHSTGHVAVLIDGHRFKSPWVDAQAVENCGALVLDDLSSADKSAPNPALDALMARAEETGVWNLPWAVPQMEATELGSGAVRWGVIPPRNPSACRFR
jgi:4-amino-4-deoxy-L-arabinose transferase-like glycosyltransferase